MNRDEVVERRKDVLKRAERQRNIGDYAAGAADIRENTEDILRLYDHILERMKG